MPRESRSHRRGRERSRSRGRDRRARNYREDVGYRTEDLVCGRWERKGFFATVFTFVIIVSAGVAVYTLEISKASNDDLTKKNTNLTAEKEKLEGKLQELNKTIKNMKDQGGNLTAKIQELEDNLQTSKSANEDLTEKAEACEQDLEILTKKNQEQSSTIEELNLKASNYQKQAEDCEAKATFF